MHGRTRRPAPVSKVGIDERVPSAPWSDTDCRLAAGEASKGSVFASGVLAQVTRLLATGQN